MRKYNDESKNHDKLLHRDYGHQHPIKSIRNLTQELDKKILKSDVIPKSKIEEIMRK